MSPAVLTMLPLLLLLLLLLPLAHANGPCQVRYGRRACTDGFVDGVLVTCDGRGTETVIPTMIPVDTVYMALQNFKLGHLKKAHLKHLKSVQCLSIRNSGLSGLDEDTFADLGALSELVLERTGLNDSQTWFAATRRSFPVTLTLSESPAITALALPEDRDHLANLKTLDVHGNALREVGSDLLDGLLNLQSLDLSENGLELFDWAALVGLPLLSELRLHANRFQTIPEEMHKVFFAVKELTLAGNRLHCNCKLAWLKSFYESAVDKELDYPSVECASPGERPQRMRDRALDTFVCSQPSAPLIQWQRREDGSVEVNCTSLADPAPTLTLTLPGGQRVISLPSGDWSMVETASPIMLTRAGTVVCDAMNSEGSATASEELPGLDASSGRCVRAGLAPLLALFALLLLLH